MTISRLQHFIENSALSDRDKDMWLHAMEILDDDQATAILEEVQEDPLELEALTRNLKVKQIAFASGDEKLMDQILEEERETL